MAHSEQADSPLPLLDPAWPRRCELLAWRGDHHVVAVPLQAACKAHTDGQILDLGRVVHAQMLPTDGVCAYINVQHIQRLDIFYGDTAVSLTAQSADAADILAVKNSVAAINTLPHRFDKIFSQMVLGILVLVASILYMLHRVTPAAAVQLETMDQRWAQLLVPKKSPVKIPPKPILVKNIGDKAGTGSPSGQGEAKRQENKRLGKKVSASVRRALTNKGLLKALGDIAQDMPLPQIVAPSAQTFRQRRLSAAPTGAAVGVRPVANGAAFFQGVFDSGDLGKQLDKQGFSLGRLPDGLGGGSDGGASDGDGAGASAAQTASAWDSRAIAQVIRARMAMIQACYEQHLVQQPLLAGKLVVQLTVGADGKAQSVRGLRNTLQPAGQAAQAVQRCVVRRFSAFRFPAPKKPPVKIRLPFLFAPSE